MPLDGGQGGTQLCGPCCHGQHLWQVGLPGAWSWRGWDSRCSQLRLPAGAGLSSEAGTVHGVSVGFPFPRVLAGETGLFEVFF